MGPGESAADTQANVTSRRPWRVSPGRFHTWPKTYSRDATANGVVAGSGSRVITSRYVSSADRSVTPAAPLARAVDIRRSTPRLSGGDRRGAREALAEPQHVVDRNRMIRTCDAHREQDATNRVEDRRGDGLEEDLVGRRESV